MSQPYGTGAGRHGAPRRADGLHGLVVRTLHRLGLLDAARRLRRGLGPGLDATTRARDAQRQREFPAFRAQYASALAPLPGARGGTARTALLVGRGILEVELALIKSLQSAGFDPVVLFRDDQRGLRPYYQLAGVRRFHTWNEFLTSPFIFEPAAARLLDRCQSLGELVAIEQDGIRVGRIAASTAIRDMRVGSFDFGDRGVRASLVPWLSGSLAGAEQATRILDAVQPALTVFWDTEYTPKGEVYDLCLARDVDVVAYGAAHNPNGLMFKRHGLASRDHHLASVSDASWELLKSLEWTASRRARLHDELAGTYANGEWFRKSWTQSNTRVATPDEVRTALGLDGRKPTAFIFPNILSDTPLMWSRPLFPTYEDWLVATVRTACENEHVNWVIKIHPANVGRRVKDGFTGDPPEIRALHRHIGPLPPHVKVVRPETELSTYSFFPVMDYCVTVRGTVGIEAARLGIPVITAAASRYSNRGFTIDSATQEEFLARVAAIEQIAPISPAERELAERFAYGTFVLRPLVMRTVTWDYGRIGESPRARIHASTGADWRSAPDLAAWAQWVSGRRAEDFLAEEHVAS